MFTGLMANTWIAASIVAVIAELHSPLAKGVCPHYERYYATMAEIRAQLAQIVERLARDH